MKRILWIAGIVILLLALFAVSTATVGADVCFEHGAHHDCAHRTTTAIPPIFITETPDCRKFDPDHPGTCIWPWKRNK